MEDRGKGTMVKHALEFKRLFKLSLRVSSVT